MAGILKFPYFHSCVFFSSEGLQRGVMEGIIREDDGAIAAGLSENIKKPPEGHPEVWDDSPEAVRLLRSWFILFHPGFLCG